MQKFANDFTKAHPSDKMCFSRNSSMPVLRYVVLGPPLAVRRTFDFVKNARTGISHISLTL